MIAAAGDQKAAILSIILELARSKLLCQHKVNVAHDKLEAKRAATAIVDLRLMFDYEPHREIARLAEADLVACHLRMAYSVPQSREYVRSGYPSEPLLAEAAAQQMHVFRSFDPDATLKILKDNVESGLLDKGERGELVARELLTSAYDRAIEREFHDLHADAASPRSYNTAQNVSTRRGGIPLYSRGVSLITFIEELFNPHYAKAVLDSSPNNVLDGKPFRVAFKDARVRFTHFGKMADDYGATTAAVWPALVRGMAIITRMGETLVDLIIPVLLRDTKLCEQAVTGILVSVKRRRSKGTVARGEVDARVIQFFSTSEGTDFAQRPYISLVMELGLQPPPPASALTRARLKGKGRAGHSRMSLTPRIHASDKGTPSKVRIPRVGRRHHTTSEHPRYSIIAYGCSNTVYKGITIAQRSIYQLLLASRDFLAEHPRQNAAALSAVRRMKPFWSVGQDCYHWVDEERLRMDVADDACAQPEHVVVLGNLETDTDECLEMIPGIETSEDKVPSVPASSPERCISQISGAPKVDTGSNKEAKRQKEG